jgi:hypothetical protein
VLNDLMRQGIHGGEAFPWPGRVAAGRQ